MSCHVMMAEQALPAERAHVGTAGPDAALLHDCWRVALGLSVPAMSHCEQLKTEFKIVARWAPFTPSHELNSKVAEQGSSSKAYIRSRVNASLASSAVRCKTRDARACLLVCCWRSSLDVPGVWKALSPLSGCMGSLPALLPLFPAAIAKV